MRARIEQDKVYTAQNMCVCFKNELGDASSQEKGRKGDGPTRTDRREGTDKLSQVSGDGTTEDGASGDFVSWQSPVPLTLSPSFRASGLLPFLSRIYM